MIPISQEFGNRDHFAIRCSIEAESDPPARNALGEVEFWLGGHSVGNRSVYSTVGTFAADIERTLQWPGSRGNLEYYGADKEVVLDRIAHYVYEVPYDDTEAIGRGERFLICMTGSGNEWTDGWLFALIEGPGDHRATAGRILFRKTGHEAHEHWLEPGIYESVVEEFLAWLREHSTYRSSLTA